MHPGRHQLHARVVVADRRRPDVLHDPGHLGDPGAGPGRRDQDGRRPRRGRDLLPARPWAVPGHRQLVQRDISAAPLAANSKQVAAFVDGPLPDLYLNDYWRGRLKTGVSIGGGVASHDNIPIYTVDSSNPYQDFANFTSTDARVTTFHGSPR